MSDGTRFVSGRDFIHAIHLRYGVLFIKARNSRGRPHLKKQRRRGCSVKETLNHVLQQCHHTHFGCIKYHEAVFDYIQRVVQDQKLIPDLVIYCQNRVEVVDAQIVNEKFPLETAHLNKVKK